MVISADFEKQKQYFVKKYRKNMVLSPYLFMVICFYRNMARENRSCAESLKKQAKNAIFRDVMLLIFYSRVVTRNLVEDEDLSGKGKSKQQKGHLLRGS